MASMQKLIGPFGATFEVKDTAGVASIELDGISVSNGTGTLAAATTLTAADGGKTYFLSAAAGAAITLPAPAAGLKFKFIVASAFATTNWTIVTNASANVIFGAVDVNSTLVLGASEDTISFVATAETIGDWVTVESDGTNWYVDGVGQAVGGITLTQASA